MRIEVNRVTYEVDGLTVSGRVLRERVGVLDSDDLYGKGEPRPYEKGLPGGGGFLIEPDSYLKPYEGQEFFTVEKAPTVFAGIPIQTDSELKDNQIKVVTATGIERIYQLEDDHLNEVTI